MSSPKIATVIVGGGPAGFAPLFAAAKHGRLEQVLQGGVVILHAEDELGSGSLRRYAIRSDSAAEAFLDAVIGSKEPRLAALLTHPAAQALLHLRQQPAPLSLVANFLSVASGELASLVKASPRGAVLTGCHAFRVTRTSDGRWRTHYLDKGVGEVQEITSDSVLLATGGREEPETAIDAGDESIDLSPYQGKTWSSQAVLCHDGFHRLRALLQGRQGAKVVILGGSSSAGSVAHRILHELGESREHQHSVTMLHRSPLRLFYDSAEQAQADGYTDFTPQHICSLTGRVFRFGGLRADARTLFSPCPKQGVRSSHPQLETCLLASASSDSVRQLLDHADVIVTAMGFRPQLLAVQDELGVSLLPEAIASSPSLVDDRCRVLDTHRQALDGLFALGLAVGPRPRPEAGGEQGFTGQVNSLWQWQNTLGLQIADQLMARSHRQPPLAHADRDASGSRNPRKPLPIVQALPPRLSEHSQELAKIERSGIYSNYGPVSTRLERTFVERMFGKGECLTVCNATIGLMLAIRAVLEDTPRQERKYALMPSFTFAAVAQAVLWCGLTPLFSDIDQSTWLPAAASEEQLLKQHAGQVALLLPCATFGNNLDLHRYQALSELHNIPVVVDAAASLGSLDAEGCAFGSGFAWPIVYSMHATKLFSVGEGGLIYSGDAGCIERLRCMGNFGFTGPRSAGIPGLNAKMSEVACLTALLKLGEFDSLMRQREEVEFWYGEALDAAYVRQQTCGKRQVKTFASVLLPPTLSHDRPRVMEDLKAQEIGTAAYFSPHLAQQPLFKPFERPGDLPATDELSSRVLNLPMLQGMSRQEVFSIAEALELATRQAASPAGLHIASSPRMDLN